MFLLRLERETLLIKEFGRKNEEGIFAVVGVRNFAADHIKFIKELEKENEVKLAAVVVEDKRKNFDIVKGLKCEGIEVFESFEELLEKGRKFIDIITLPTAIHTHSEMAIKAMESGYDVLLKSLLLLQFKN